VLAENNSHEEDPGFGQGLSSTPDGLTVDDVCVGCRQGFHDECISFWMGLSNGHLEWFACCCGGDFDTYKHLRAEQLSSSLPSSNYVDAEDEQIETYFDGFDGSKHPSEYADPLSSGRKKAAKVAPIAPGMICEWAWLAKAGGGVIPIIGCPGRPASDRHHGPDKNTLHNNVGVNLHRICDWCHNQWHAKNDPHYGPRPTNSDGSVDASVPFLPDVDWQEHDGKTRASDATVYEEDAYRREEARRHGAKI